MKQLRLPAVITIKHVSTFVNKVEDLFEITRNFDLVDKCRYVFYGYDGSCINARTVNDYRDCYGKKSSKSPKDFLKST
jgi:hypothetical protein